MSEEIVELQKTCPGCGELLKPAWFVCPLCGLRLKPANNFASRAAMWIIVLLAFVLMELFVAKTDVNAAQGFAVVFGIPLAYVFGKAVLFRISGTPLTWRQLRDTSVRVGTITFMFVVVMPTVIGIALLLLLFAICGGFNR